jgi:CHAT domain-containing protein
VLDGLRRRNAELSPATSWQVLACGDPIHHTSLPPLPGAARELDELSTLLGNVVTPLRGADATAAAFLSRAPTASHIHIASHAAGSIDGAEPFVLFSGDGDDQFLYASQVQAASLRADLVVLSACSTSIGQASIGEGAMSMARAFLWAGCRCVLATFWPAQDDMTAFWVQLFYASLLKEKSVARAAYAAREELRQMHARMRHWTAFQVFGDGDSWDDRYSLAHLRSPRHEPDER